jgi:hypothetical protein
VLTGNQVSHFSQKTGKCITGNGVSDGLRKKRKVIKNANVVFHTLEKWEVTEKSELSVFRESENYFQNSTS